MSAASNLSKSVASASPTLVHFNQDRAQHLHMTHPANIMEITQNARNFVGLQSQDGENNMQDVNREGKVGWPTSMQEKRSHQQPSQSWIHYGPPTLSPIQAPPPIRCYPENEDPDSKGQKRSWSDAVHVKADDNDRKRSKTNYSMIDSKDVESEYRKLLSSSYPQMAGGEMPGYFLPPPDHNKHLSKDLQVKMNKIDGEIAMAEHTIANLKAKCSELSKVKRLSEKDNVQEAVLEVSESRPQTIARLIYNQNKLKAQQSHNSLASFGPITSLPLYNQPSDTLVYRENKKKFQTFKKLLVVHLAKKQQAEKIRIRYLSERYTQLYNQWVKKLSKRENSSVRREKDAKYREFFEKVFPDLKKQKDDKEKLQSRFAVPGNRPAGYARSDAGVEEIVNELHEQEVKEKRMLSLSVTPPMMMDSRQRSLRIIDETRLIRSFDFRQKIWTPSETEIFAEKYQQYPKKFVIISSYLENKTVQDCVLFYYLTKKEANYKQMARRYQAMKKKKFRSTTQQNPQNQDSKMGDSSSTASEPSIGSGFSLPSTILLSSSMTANFITPSNYASYLCSSTSASIDQSKTLTKAEQDSPPTKHVGTSEVALDKAADVKKMTGTSEGGKEASHETASSAENADASEVKLELKVENQETVDEGDTKCANNENMADTKAFGVNEDKISPHDSPRLSSSETSSSISASPIATATAPVPSPTSAVMMSTRLTPTPSTMSSLTLPTAATMVNTEPIPTLDKRDHVTGYISTSMGVEDVSDKEEDGDSVATLSADEGPSMPLDENKELSQIKRPRLLDDGYKDGMDRKRQTEDLVLNWEAKNKHPIGVKRLSVDENNHQFFMMTNSERERKSLPPSEDRQIDPKYHDMAENDLVFSLVAKNRSPARIKDLIHAAIEKNLQNNVLKMEGDLNGCTSPIGSWSSRGETPNNLMPSPHSLASHQFQQHYQQYQKHPLEPPTQSRHPALMNPATNDLAQQHLSMKMISHDRSNSYSPSRYPVLNPHEVAPPPAHSHHHHNQMKNASYEKPSSRGPPAAQQYLENNRLYELAAVAAERGRLDEKEKRQHKENVGREMSYPGNIPLSLLRLPCDPAILHKGLRGNSGGQHPTVPVVPSLAGIHMVGGRGSITKGTSGRLEAMQQQGSMERHAPPHDWPVTPRTTSAFSLGGLPAHPSAVDYLSSAQVLRGDFLTAHQMGQSHFPQPSHLYNIQQQYQQHYQNLARQGEKKHGQSLASSEHHVHNKNHSNQEPLKKKSRQENAGKNVYHDQTEYPQHKKVLDDPRTHSRNQQLSNYYPNQSESHHYMNDAQRPMSSHQQQNNASSLDKQMEFQKVNKAKEFQPNQMTAANLIEAIIYLQINRSESDENSLKMSGPSNLSNSNPLSHLPAREESLHDRNSNSYERTQKYGQIQTGDHPVRATSENRNHPERMGFSVKEDKPVHLSVVKHIKDNNHVKKFNPYDQLNQSQNARQDLQNPHSSVSGKKLKTASDRIEAIISQDIDASHGDLSSVHGPQKFKASGDPSQVSRDEPPPQKFITASDRIEAIIAQDIGNQDDLPIHNEDFHLAIKEYMKNTNTLDASFLARFPYASIRPYDADKHYDKSYTPFYNPGVVGGFVPLRMAIGQHPPSDDKSSSQNILSPKLWQHGPQQVVSERNQISENRPAPAKQITTTDLRHGNIQSLLSSCKDQRSEHDNLSSLKRSPSQQQFKSPSHRTPDPTSDGAGAVANCSEKTTSKDQDDGSNACSNGPPISSHMTWKAKMLRQHKEQKIAENSQGQHHASLESSSQIESKNSKEEETLEERRSNDRSSADENKIVAVVECKDNSRSVSSSSSLTTPSGSGRQPSPAAKLLNHQENSLDVANNSTNLQTPPNYWSPRSSTGKCSSNSSDGLRIDVQGEEEKLSDNHD